MIWVTDVHVLLHIIQGYGEISDNILSKADVLLCLYPQDMSVVVNCLENCIYSTRLYFYPHILKQKNFCRLTGRLGIFCSLAQKYEEEKQLQLKLHRHGFSLLCSFLQYIHDSRYFKSHKLFLNSENAEPEVKDSIGLRNCFLQYFEKIYEENI